MQFILISTFIAHLLSLSLSAQHCQSDLDCQSNQVCVYEQKCDENGCTKSANQVCKQSSSSQIIFQKQEEIEQYLQDLSQSDQFQYPQLVIRSSPGLDSMITFQKKGDSFSEFRMGIEDISKKFVIQYSDSQKYLSMDSQSGEINMPANLKIEDSLKIGLNGSISINGITQWQMIHEESQNAFDLQRWQTKSETNCPTLTITKCGGIYLLGGYGILSSQILRTTINLQNYKYSWIKIQGIFHFIDGWAGQIAYLRIGGTQTYLWTDSFDFTQTKNTLNLCGSDIGEGKFTSLIEAVISREEGVVNDQLVLEFGSTLETDPYYASYAISSLRIYIR